MRFFMKKRSDHRKAKIINLGTCIVELGAKKVRLGVDAGTIDEPEYLIFLPTNGKWDNPKGENFTEEEVREMQNFIPRELCRRDGVIAIVELGLLPESWVIE